MHTQWQWIGDAIAHQPTQTPPPLWGRGRVGGPWLRFPFSQTTTSAGALGVALRLVAYCVGAPGFQSSTRALHSHAEDSSVFSFPPCASSLPLGHFDRSQLIRKRICGGQWFCPIEHTPGWRKHSSSCPIRRALCSIAFLLTAANIWNPLSFHSIVTHNFILPTPFFCTLCCRAFPWLIRNTSLCCC